MKTTKQRPIFNLRFLLRTVCALEQEVDCSTSNAYPSFYRVESELEIKQHLEIDIDLLHIQS